MSKRFVGLFAAIVTAAACIIVLPIASASASSPWWQIVMGTRPSNLWEPQDNVQEIVAETGELVVEGTPTGLVGAAAQVLIGEEAVACMGTKNTVGEGLCPGLYGFPVSETAPELQAALEAALGTPAEVTGGPVGVEPFVVTFPGRGVPTIGFFQKPEYSSAGDFSAKVLSAGGSGRLAVTITNLGDAPLDATGTPLTIVDELPEGVKAVDVEAFGGVRGEAGPVDCELEASDFVSCSFEDVLTPYESIELELLVNLVGEPPVEGAPGKVTVSGGNGPTESAIQGIHVSPQATPFGIEYFSSRVEEEGGAAAEKAGGHPFQLSTTIQLNSGQFEAGPDRHESSVEQPAQPRNLRFPLPAGFVGNVATAPTCNLADFYEASPLAETANRCPDASAIGAVSALFALEPLGILRPAVPLFNLQPGAGEPARFGFVIARVPTIIDTEVDPDNGYQIVASVRNVSQVPKVLSSTVSIWGTPGDPRHDNARGWGCVYNLADAGPCERPANLSEDAYLRQPVSCVTPLSFEVEAEPWNVPSGSFIDEKTAGGGTLNGCNQVPFNPSIAAAPTNRQAGGASGLSFHLTMPNDGLLQKNAIAEGQAKKVEVTLPEGVTVNPSQANGLGACTPQDYSRETAESAPGEGCPESSKIGSVDIATPLLEEEAHGSVYVASPYDNPFDSLLALYVVAKIPDRGILVKQAGKAVLNSDTGQLITTFDDLPQLPFSSFDLHFKEGDRAPLVMPETCGSYDIVAKFTPWNAADPNSPQPNEIVTKTSSFQVDQGPNGSACPSGTPPFNPKFTAGTVNNAAGSYSAFNARLTREDGEQEFTRFSLKLPKGVIGNLSGIPFCSEAAIAQARSRTGAGGGREELESPSCSAASRIGGTLVGTGVGSTLTYVPGKAYLAGPYQGAKLSVVAITPAKVGPFDLGNVVIRQALKVDPDTAEVSTDGSSADPIPHILQGIVVHARDIRIYVDRQDFVLNPTSCKRVSAVASVVGSGSPVDVSAPFQAAGCAGLGFKPKLALTLSGGTTRGDTPRLKAVLTARKGDANIGTAEVTLPHSEFLEQAHIRTVCTRVQFAAGGGNGEQCPKGSVYGRVKAVTPLLDEPLTGPVYLRSSSHKLPDLVAALHSGKVDINLDGRIDSVRNGRIRNTFEAVPDAPVTKFTLEMQGGKKGLLVNSRNICRGKNRAIATFIGQNGKRHEFNPLVKAKCGGKKKRKKR